MPPELIPPDFPEPLRHVWEWFLELCSTRQSAFSGIAPISFQEIRAWQDVMDIDATPYEIGLIRTLDILFKGTLENGNGNERDQG